MFSCGLFSCVCTTCQAFYATVCAAICPHELPDLTEKSTQAWKEG